MNPKGTPYLTTGDGNCLFNAASIALTGNESLSKEIRLRTALEMIINQHTYLQHPLFNALLVHSPEFEDAMLECCRDGAYSSIFTMMALSNVIGKPIRSIFPDVNGPPDPTAATMTKVFTNETIAENDTLTILWCRMGPKTEGTWYPNHFVPVIDTEVNSTQQKTSTPLSREKTVPYASSLQDGLKNELSITEVASPIIEDNDCKHIKNNADNSLFQTTSDDRTFSPPRKVRRTFDTVSTPQITNSESSSHTSVDFDNETLPVPENVTENTSHDGTESDNKTLPIPDNVTPLINGKWFEATQVFKVISERNYVHSDVPPGNKSNCY